MYTLYTNKGGIEQRSRKQFHIGGASSHVRCLAREGGGGGGGGLGETLKACCNTVTQFAEFMHAGNNIGGARPPLSGYWGVPPPPPIPTPLLKFT